MNTREIGEIRRRTRRDRSNIPTIYGCYVNGNKEIVAEFSKSVGLMPENEAEKYFAALKRTLSGTLGKNLLDITFRTSQVADSPEHKLLMDLRKTGLADGEIRKAFYEKVIASVTLQDSYLILLGCDSYDVPFKSKDDTLQADASSEVYTYLQCAICPVKQDKGGLCYEAESRAFQDGGLHQVAGAPELGFLFPAFDGRSTNIYNALFYTRSPKLSHAAFVEEMFQVQAPVPAEEQKKTFRALLGSTLGDACSLDVVQSVHDSLRQCIEIHKETRSPEMPRVSKEQVKAVLEDCAVPAKNVAKFSVDFDSAFGADTQLSPKNIMDGNRIVVKTPDVTIQVSPERSDLLETRIIDGVKYILICAEESVEVNGVPVSFGEEKQDA